jgi:thymidylate kinase
MKTFITGISGTGKTSIANALKERGVIAFSIDEVEGLCHWVNKTDGKVVDYEAKLDKEFIDSHVWVCDTEKLKELINQNENVVVLGMAENQEEFIPLFDKVLLLQCKPETFLKRIESREDNVFGKDKSAQEYLLNTYQEFENKMLEKGAVPIDVEKPLEEVVEEIIKQI